jgi:hypothetical protein
MLSEDKVIALYCIVDDLLKAMRHHEDCRVQVKDSEIITTAFVSVLYFHGHMDNARMFMKMKGYTPRMLDKSRFCRRLHRLSELLFVLFQQFGQKLKDMAGAADYLLDSFPVPACDNVRIFKEKRLCNKGFRGKWSAMSRWFYGVRVQVLTLEGIPVEFCFTPGSQSDTHALTKLPLSVAPESNIWADAGYTDYKIEDLMLQQQGVWLLVHRKSNSKRKDEPWMDYLKQQVRKMIETHFSCIKARMPRSIHAVTAAGFYLKTALFIIAYAFEAIIK